MSVLGRREFLVGVGALAGVLASVRLDPRSAAALAPPSVPAARTFETGLANFIARWEIAAPLIQYVEETRAFAAFIVNKTFNCETSDRIGSMHLTLTAYNGALAPGPNPMAFMTLRMPEADWVAACFGPYHFVATAISGRTWIAKDHMNAAFVLGAVMNLLAQIDGERVARLIASGEIPEANLDARCGA